jgi:hypothetical protein
MDRAELTQALDAIWQRVRRLNRYVEEQAPWQLAKDDARAGDLDRVLRTLAEGLRVVTVLLWPWNEHVTVAMPPVPFDSMCHVHPTTPLLPTGFQGLCRPALLPACSAPEPAVHGAAHAWIP